MIIDLDLIKPSPHPIRTSWDEEKMQELAESIKEQGLIVPIKVKPLFDECPWHGYEYVDCSGERAEELINCDGCMKLVTEYQENFIDNDIQPYEIVYGHRRTEACRRAGLEEIECIVEGLDDESAFWQAIIENVCRDDINDFEEGKSYKILKEDYGYSTENIASKIGKNTTWVSRCIALINDPISDNLLVHSNVQSPANIAEITREPFRGDQVMRGKVIEKISKEGLGRKQARDIVQSIAVTKDPRRKEALLNTPYSSFIHDPEMNKERAEKFGEHDPLYTPKVMKSDEFQFTMEVKALIDRLRLMRDQTAPEVIKMFDAGKFSPEAVPFIVREIKKVIQAWQSVIDKLGDEDV